MRTLDAIILLLEQRGVGLGGTNIFAGSDAALPDVDTEFLTINETAGRPPVGIHNSIALRQPAFQIVSRAGEYLPAGNLLELAYNALGGKEPISNLLVGDVFFLSLRPTSEPFSLPPDARNRVRLAFNVNSVRR